MTARKKKAETDNFEASLQRLEAIVEELEGDLALDKAIALYEEGRKLGKNCSKHLTEIEKRVLQLIDKGDGETEYEEFESPADSDAE